LLAADQPLGVGLKETIRVNPQGLRVGPQCPEAQLREVALWPAPLEPWLPRVERSAARLPEASTQCPPPALSAVTPLSIVGVRDGDRLRRPAASQALLRLAISTLGGEGRRWWFINGAPLGDSTGHEVFNTTLEQVGRYELSVLDESGQTARVEFSVVE